MDTKDQTTAFVVASPTPLAPPDAWKPHVQLIRAIVPPKATAFNKQTPKSFIYTPNHAESKYDIRLKSDVRVHVAAPVSTPTTDAKITITGIINIPERTLGTKRYSTGLTFRTCIASICSVTRIVASSDAIDEPIIEVIANPDIIAPTSLIISIVISKPTKCPPPCLTISSATCEDTIIDVIPTVTLLNEFLSVYMRC